MAASASNYLVESIEDMWHFGRMVDMSNSEAPLIINQDQPVISDEDEAMASPTSCRSDSSHMDIDILHKLNELFDSIDENGDGLVSIDAISALLQRLGCQLSSCTASSEANYDIYQPIDCVINTNGSAQLNFEEFVSLYQLLTIQPEMVSSDSESTSEDEYIEERDELLKDAFELYDKNSDGFICASELASVLAELGLLKEDNYNHELSRMSYCQGLIDRVDQNGDGVIDLHEFKAMILQASA